MGSKGDAVSARCVVVGGGPAGMMAGYLLARAGIDVLVLEKHADFLRDFRGDTVHPSTMEILDQLGLLEDFLARPHSRLTAISADIEGRRLRLGDFSRLKVRAPFIALMPQWDFLDFLAENAKALANFRLLKSTEATGLRQAEGVVTGIEAVGPDGPVSIEAALVIAADGRHSKMRQAAGLPVRDLGAPIDVLWFRIGRDAAVEDETLGRVRGGRFMVTINRGSYWQCAYVIAKGAQDELRAAPIQAFRDTVLEASPHLAAHIGELKSWDDTKLLSVKVDRLERWSKPGLLCIGDAAHAMSPIGGVGINMAIQDAVAAANLLADPLRWGTPAPALLEAVEKRRLLPVRLVQAVQVMIQNRVLVPTISGKRFGVPWPFRLLDRIPALQGLPARAVGLGFRPERVSEEILAARR